jgi:predicted  nucleic acid-binding Zn-ribbon protein
MKSQAEALYNLQQIDLQRLRLDKRLQEIGSELEDNQAVSAAEDKLEEAQNFLAPLKLEMREIEREIQSTEEKNKSSEDRLYSGSVRNPKELQDLQQEIASLKHRLDTLEDKLLEQMMNVEEAESEVRLCNKTLSDVIEQWNSDHRDLVIERQDLHAELESLNDQRQLALQFVAAESLKLYDNMKKKKANQPIAAFVGTSCSACGIEQTMAIQQEVHQAKSLVTCLNCGRVLADINL